MKIGVFDSGLGGLTILKAIAKELPQYDYLYLGDNARVPYGGRSGEIIYQFTREAVAFLFQKGCKLVILACNSATANALRRLQQEDIPRNYPDRRALGIIKPTVEYVLGNREKRIGIMGTYATVESEAYLREVGKVVPEAKVQQQSCPLLVPLIEEDEFEGPLLKLALTKYLQPLLAQKPQVVLLACTHYGLIKRQVEKMLGPQIKVVDQGKLVAAKLKLYLHNHPEIESKLSKKHRRIYYVTDLNLRFGEIAEKFLGEKVSLTKINL